MSGNKYLVCKERETASDGQYQLFWFDKILAGYFPFLDIDICAIYQRQTTTMVLTIVSFTVFRR
jgi:hypothetical protein